MATLLMSWKEDRKKEEGVSDTSKRIVFGTFIVLGA
jgi:hypothetical protein